MKEKEGRNYKHGRQAHKESQSKIIKKIIKKRGHSVDVAKFATREELREDEESSGSTNDNETHASL